jgi:ribonuclease BN (tRNA processing enzyme)
MGETFVIFDAGSGIQALGAELSNRQNLRELWLFITHFHPAHVEGLAKFSCLSNPDLRVHVCSAAEPDKTLRAMLEQTLLKAQNPVALKAQFEVHELVEKIYEPAPGLRLTSFYANHPGTTLGFILEAKGLKVVYCPDSELYGDTTRALQDYDERLGKLCTGADLLIHDGRYTHRDYAENKNNGHSSASNAVDCAKKSQVKRLWLIHQDAKYSDVELDEMQNQAVKQAAGSSLVVEIARETGCLSL